jgi:hypothetical protein
MLHKLRDRLQTRGVGKKKWAVRFRTTHPRGLKWRELSLITPSRRAYSFRVERRSG